MSMRLQITVVVPSGAIVKNALGCSVGFWPGGTSAFGWAHTHGGNNARPTLPPTVIAAKRRRVNAGAAAAND
jgi:hypothetical protein